MILVLALAIGTLGPAPEAPVDVRDCVRSEPVKPKHRSKAVNPKYRPKPIFKTDPKPIIEDDCGEGVLPPAPSIALEPVYEYSPIPFAELTPDVPMLDVPPVEEGPPCECLSASPLVYVFAAGVPAVVGFTSPGVLIPAVPEPEIFALTLVGLGLLVNRLRTRRITRRSNKQ